MVSTFRGLVCAHPATPSNVFDGRKLTSEPSNPMVTPCPATSLNTELVMNALGGCAVKITAPSYSVMSLHVRSEHPQSPPAYSMRTWSSLFVACGTPPNQTPRQSPAFGAADADVKTIGLSAVPSARTAPVERLEVREVLHLEGRAFRELHGDARLDGERRDRALVTAADDEAVVLGAADMVRHAAIVERRVDDEATARDAGAAAAQQDLVDLVARERASGQRVHRVLLDLDRIRALVAPRARDDEVS